MQREEFKRLGVTGDWDNPYLTMNFRAEALIANELLKFASSGQLYRGSKPVMWSVVEKTALAEAEVEYQDYQSDTVYVKFPVRDGASNLLGASVVIWTTTPWTIPGNRAISFSSKIAYGLYEVTAAPEGNWAKAGDKLHPRRPPCRRGDEGRQGRNLSRASMMLTPRASPAAIRWRIWAMPSTCRCSMATT